MSEATNMKAENPINAPQNVVDDFIKRQKERDSAPKEKMSRRDFLKLAGKGALIIAGTAVAGKFISSLGNVGTGEGKPPVPPKEIPSTYDASAPDAWTGPSNSIQMTLEESKKAAQPIWQEEEKTMTILLPIKSKDGQIRTLHVQKMTDPTSTQMGHIAGNNMIQIDAGLEEGDIVFAPYSGKLALLTRRSQRDISVISGALFLDSDPENNKSDDSVVFYTTELNPLLDFSQATEDDAYFYWDVQKGQPIGEILTSYKNQPIKPKVSITGLGRLRGQENFNLATFEGKAIIVK